MNPAQKCGTCGRDPQRMNSPVAECSHVECPHRRHQWSDGTGPSPWRPKPKPRDPYGRVFDNPEKTK